MNLTIRYTEMSDWDQIQNIYSYARSFMKKTGNPNQWKDSSPADSLVFNDINNRNSYVICNSEEIVGVFSFIVGQDPTYSYIEGKWLNDEPYGTIHRIASSGKYKGIFEVALNHCSSIISNIRIDTHNDNKVMQNKIIKNGFEYCGIIYIADGSPRLAYQKI